MCGGDLPETKMEEHVFAILEETPRILMDECGNMLTCSAVDIAKELKTTPQIIGKVMKFCDDFWVRKVKNSKVSFAPKKL